MLSRILSFILFLGLSTSALAQSITASMAYKQFKYGDQILVETYLRVPGTSLEYKAVKGGFQAEIKATYYFEEMDSDNIHCGNKLIIYSPVLESKSASQDIYFKEKCLIPAGKYKLSVELQDNIKQGKSIKAKQPVMINEFGASDHFSDLIFIRELEKAEKDHMMYKSGYKMIPFIPNGDYFFDGDVNEFSVYLENYNIPTDGKRYYLETNILKLEDRTAISRYNMKKAIKNGSTSNKFAHTFDISELESGNYFFSVALKNSDHEIVAEKEEIFQNFNPNKSQSYELTDISIEAYMVKRYRLDSIPVINGYLYAMSYSKDPSERTQYINAVSNDNLKEKQNFFFNHWNEMNSADIEKPFLAFKTVYDYTNAKFGNQVLAGFKSDRGRVLLKYGNPDDVEAHDWDTETHPYEIWQYYDTGIQKDVIFVFFDPSTSGSYTLLHSNALNEKTLPEWQRIISRRSDGVIDSDNFGTKFQNNSIINQGLHHPLEEN